MANTTSSFLQGVNMPGSGSASTTSAIDEDSVLGAISKPSITGLSEAAEDLGTSVSKIEPIVKKLTDEGFFDQGSFSPSEAGQRYLRFKSMSG